MSRIRLVSVCLLVAAVTYCTAATGNLCWCRASEPAPQQIRRIDRSLSAACRFLVRAQSDDGAWRSDVYGAFKEGDALTPLVLAALLESPASDSHEQACRRAADYLASMVSPDGTIVPSRFGLAYPVYTA